MGSAHFDFLAGIPAAGIPAKKLVRIAHTPKRHPPPFPHRRIKPRMT